MSCVKSRHFVSAVFPFSPFSRFRGFRVFAWPAPASPGAETHVSYAQPGDTHGIAAKQEFLVLLDPAVRLDAPLAPLPGEVAAAGRLWTRPALVEEKLTAELSVGAGNPQKEKGAPVLVWS